MKGGLVLYFLLPLTVSKASLLPSRSFTTGVRHHWRPHAFMRSYLASHDVPRLDLRPDPALIDGQTFDPVAHFRRWQHRHGSDGPALRERARIELLAAVRSLPEDPGRWQAAADDLNRRGITTGTGRRWTSEGVRKAYSRQQPVPDKN